MARTATDLQDRPRLVKDADIPDLPHGCNSWIVTANSDGLPRYEIYNRRTLKCLKADMVTVWTAKAWLEHFNRAQKPNLPVVLL